MHQLLCLITSGMCCQWLVASAGCARTHLLLLLLLLLLLAWVAYEQLSSELQSWIDDCLQLSIICLLALLMTCYVQVIRLQQARKPSAQPASSGT
jgi:type VI protein secretion system component VasK